MQAVAYCSHVLKNIKNIDNQKKECQAFADVKKIKIVKFFIDIGSSGRIKKKKELCNLLKYVSKNNVDYLIVNEWDNLSRNQEDLSKLKSVLKGNGVKPLSVQQIFYEINFPILRFYKNCLICGNPIKARLKKQGQKIMKFYECSKGTCSFSVSEEDFAKKWDSPLFSVLINIVKRSIVYEAFRK